jgi:hypothetical protein
LKRSNFVGQKAVAVLLCPSSQSRISVIATVMLDDRAAPVVNHVWAISVLTTQLLCGALIGWLLLVRLSRDSLSKALSACRVSPPRVKRVIAEIERKTFHIMGLLVPLIFQLLLHRGVPRARCARICWAITVVGCAGDALRVWGPKRIRDARFWRVMPLRAHEVAQLSGCCYFSLGAWRPPVA